MQTDCSGLTALSDIMAYGDIGVHTRVANANGEILIQIATTKDTGNTNPVYVSLYYTKSTD